MPPSALEEDHGHHETQAQQGHVTELEQLGKHGVHLALLIHGAFFLYIVSTTRNCALPLSMRA